MTDRVLLDANVLIALSFADHEHHSRVVAWFGTSRPFATTPSVQGSLVRFAVRVATIIHANDLLDELAANALHTMWPDDQAYSSHLLRGVTGHRQVTDAYLAEIAASHQTMLATMDTGLKNLRPETVELIA
jgi:uncharacterized protein